MQVDAGDTGTRAVRLYCDIFERKPENIRTCLLVTRRTEGFDEYVESLPEVINLIHLLPEQVPQLSLVGLHKSEIFPDSSHTLCVVDPAVYTERLFACLVERLYPDQWLSPIIREHWSSTPYHQHAIVVPVGVHVPEYDVYRPPGFQAAVYRIGDGAEKDPFTFATLSSLVAHLEQDPELPIPGKVLGLECDVARFTALHAARAATLRSAWGDVATAYGGRAALPVTAVAFHTSRFSTVLSQVVSDCADSLPAGVTPHVIREQADWQPDCALAFARTLAAHQPAVAISLNHLKVENPAYPGEVQHVCWFQDEMPHQAQPNFVRSANEGAGQSFYAYSSLAAARFTALGYPHVGTLPFGVNPKRFPYARDPRKTWSQPVALISNMVRLPDKHPQLTVWLANRFPEGTAVPLDPHSLLEEYICDTLYRVQYQERAELRYFLWHMLRTRNLEYYAKEVGRYAPLAVYGLGWDGILDPGVWRGPLGPEALPGVYASAKATLTLQDNLLLHARVLETFCTGGLALQLATAQSPPERLGKGVYFSNCQELLELVTRQGFPGPEMQERAEAARVEVFSLHTYAHRMQQVLRDVSESILPENQAHHGAV